MKTDPHWKPIGFKPHHGIAIPLFAIHTKNSLGIGEFLDLIPLIDWCKSVKFNVIQLLPLNDSGDDLSPYNPLSSSALDPIYLSLSNLPDGQGSLESFASFAPFQGAQRLAKREIKQAKMQWLYSYFEKMFPSMSKEKSYETFLQKHPWLSHYALFKALKDEYGQKCWEEWPEAYRSPQEAHFEEKKKAIDFHKFIQYLCFSQMERVKVYASKQNVLLKGDVPILVSPDSAGVWAEPRFFNRELVAGAPPDFFNLKGQKWGFPLFNLEEMRKEGFSWWKTRLKAIEDLYHLYRIDHVVGLFRIWAIPPDKPASDGFFVERDESLWMGQGEELLNMLLDNSSLLPIAEDLGTIPKGVRPLLHQLGIPSTNVIRWERDWAGDKSYIPYEKYDPFSLTTLSTADAEVTKMWWKNFPEDALAFSRFKNWTYYRDLKNDQLFELIKDSHHTPSYFHINLLQEYLSLFTDLSASNLDNERINIPGTILPTNWTHRYRPSIEELISHEKLQEMIKHLDL